MTTSVSVVCGVMDRMGHLAQALPTWLACPEVTEVVLIDWSSVEPLPESADDPRVRVMHVVDRPHWHASKCHNLGLRLARCELVLRLDADDLLVTDQEGRSFFEVHDHTGDGCFFRLDQTKLCESDQVHLAGVIYARKKDLLAVGGYNERVRVYGGEDDDLVARLAASGATVLDLDLKTLYHLPHHDEERVRRVPLKDYPELLQQRQDACWTWNLGTVARSIELNKGVAARAPWTPSDEMATFELSQGALFQVGKTARRVKTAKRAREVAPSTMTRRSGARDGLVRSSLGVSLLTGVMGRTETFFRSLTTWVREAIFDELVLVSWRAPGAEADELERRLSEIDFRGRKVTLLRALEEKTWQPGPCFNLGLAHATLSHVLKLDADVSVRRPEGYGSKPLLLWPPAGTFFAGDWLVARDENEKHLSGVVCASRADLLSVNGWNERVTTYGYDDADLYARLAAAGPVGSGLKRELINLDIFCHEEHGDELRLGRKPLGASSCYTSAELNRIACERRPWTRDEQLISWETEDAGIIDLGIRVFSCRRASRRDAKGGW